MVAKLSLLIQTQGVNLNPHVVIFLGVQISLSVAPDVILGISLLSELKRFQLLAIAMYVISIAIVSISSSLFFICYLPMSVIKRQQFALHFMSK